MGTILIGVDGSAASLQAIRYASGLAAALGETATLAFVNPPLAPLSPEVVIPDAWAGELRHQGEQLLAEAERSCTWKSRPALRLAEGPVAETLAQIATSEGATLLVVGQSGSHALAGTLLGSVSDRLVQISPCPVLIGPGLTDLYGREKARAFALARIVVGIDGSVESKRACGLAARLAAVAGARLVLANAVPPPALPARVLPGFSWCEEAARDWAAQLLREAAKGLEVPSDAVVRCAPPAAMLCALADEVDADLVVVGHRGREGMDRLLLGSVASGVLRRSRRPVLVVR